MSESLFPLESVAVRACTGSNMIEKFTRRDGMQVSALWMPCVTDTATLKGVGCCAVKHARPRVEHNVVSGIARSNGYDDGTTIRLRHLDTLVPKPLYDDFILL